MVFYQPSTSISVVVQQHRPNKRWARAVRLLDWNSATDLCHPLQSCSGRVAMIILWVANFFPSSPNQARATINLWGLNEATARLTSRGVSATRVGRGPRTVVTPPSREW